MTEDDGVLTKEFTSVSDFISALQSAETLGVDHHVSSRSTLEVRDYQIKRQYIYTLTIYTKEEEYGD